MNEHENNQLDQAELDKALTHALRRVNAPETLAQFLMIAAEAEDNRRAAGGGMRLVKLSGGKVLAFPKPRVWWGSAIAAMLVLGVFVSQHEHRISEQRRAEQQFELSQQITDKALEHARAQLRHAGISLDEQ